MWISSKAFEWFGLSRDIVADYKEQVALLRQERDSLKGENARLAVINDWMRLQVNQLQFERAALLEKAYSIRVPAPEITRPREPDFKLDTAQFEDVGDEAAAQLGLE